MSAASDEADTATLGCFFPSMPNHVQVEDELKIIPLDLKSASSLETFGAGKGTAVQSIVLVAWSLVLREFVGSDSVRFGWSVHAKDDFSAGIQSYGVNIYDSMVVQDIIQHFDRLQADNADGLQASEPYPFNSCVIMTKSNKDESLDNVNIPLDRWGKDIIPTVS